jgi:hypothetical protein
MRRTNRIEPITASSDAGDLTRATVTTTTRMEYVRRIQVVPMVSKSEYSMLSLFSNRMSRRISFFLFTQSN